MKNILKVGHYFVVKINPLGLNILSILTDFFCKKCFATFEQRYVFNLDKGRNLKKEIMTL